MESPLRILHLEDNDLDAELIMATLESEGVTGEWQRVQNREDFVNAVQAADFDVILADYALPAFDGLNALALAQAVHPEVPFIFVSGALGEERAIEAFKRGATDYVVKTHLHRLAPAVRRALREAQERVERQRAQVEVDTEREWLRVTLASIGDAVIATDTQGKITFMNMVAQSLTGWLETDAVGRPITEVFKIVNENTLAPLESPVSQVLRERGIVGLANHTVLITKTGQNIPIDDSGAPIYNADQELIGVVLVFRDMRERRRAEVLLRESEERYRSLVAATTTLVWSTDANGQMVTPNPDWEAYTGQRWPDYQGDGWLKAIHPDDQPRIQATWAQSIAQPTLYKAQSRLWHAASNDYHYYNSNGVPLLDAEGHVREWVGTATDIHESKLAQQRIEEAAERTLRSQAIIAALAQALTPAEVVEVIVTHGLRILDAAAGAVTLLNEAGTAVNLVGSSGYWEDRLSEWKQIPLADNVLPTEAIKTRQPVWIESQAAYEARYPTNASAQVGPPYEARALLPLIFEDRVLGTLGFSFATPKTFTQTERDLLITLARQCAQALERAQLFEAEQKARAEAQILNAKLEARVSERTAQLEAVLMELRAANSELEREISERRQAEDRIRESERRLAEAQHLARLGSWYWDMENKVITWSDQMYRIYGLEPGPTAVRYESYVEHIHPEDRALSQAMIAKAMETHGSFSYDHRIVLSTGEVRTVHAQGEAIVDDNGKLIAMSGTGQDITDRKEIEEELRDSREQLRQLSGYLQAAREEERSRISREIHDQFGGALTALKMDVRQVQRALNEQTPTEETRAKLHTRLDSMAELIDSTTKTIRRIAADLRPSVLDDLGLEAAIEWQLQEFQTRSGIHCDLILEVSDLALDKDGSTALFRVFQEALTNVARHAQATHIDVNLSKENEFLILEVRDNGKGISPENMIGHHSLGLVGMRERVGLLSGDLNISGKPGEGTTILARIPLNQPKKTGPLPVP